MTAPADSIVVPDGDDTKTGVTRSAPKAASPMTILTKVHTARIELTLPRRG